MCVKVCIRILGTVLVVSVLTGTLAQSRGINGIHAKPEAMRVKPQPARKPDTRLSISLIASADDNEQNEQEKEPRKKKSKHEITLQDPIQQGKILLEARCSSCHATPQPSTHTLSEWPTVLSRMAPRAFLRESEVKLIEQYLENDLKSNAGTGSKS
jgi:hypothetical protein